MSDTTKVKYLITKTATSESILVTGSYTRTIASTSPKFAAVRNYLDSTPVENLDQEHLLRLIDSGAEMVRGITSLSPRVTYEDGKLYFDHDVLDNAIGSHIVRMLHNDDDNYLAFVSFLENLASNPSKFARTQLFNWIKDRNFTITDDGFFLAYKGVQNHPDNLSISRGVEKVWVDGKEFVGNIPNPIGATVEMARSNVDDASHRGCSTGLHAGTHNYANNFGRKLLLVKINPRDVVSVPVDCDFEKLRVCRYEVLDLAAGQIESTTYSGKHKWQAAEEEQAPVPVCDYCGEATIDGDSLCQECYDENEYEDSDDSCDCGCDCNC